MLERWNAFLSSVPMTVAGGLSLLVSLGLEWMGGAPPVDPAWVSVVICGFSLLYLAVSRVRKNSGIRKISSALLISIAMFAAIGIGDLFAAGEVAFIMAIGAIIEEKTAMRAKKGLKNLIRLAPEEGRRIANGKEERIPAHAIRKGDVLRILPGESIPADGKIISGNSSVDQSVLTGESLPVDKGIGDLVLCDTLNRFGSMDICVTKSGADSSLHKLIRMVREAEANKAPMGSDIAVDAADIALMQDDISRIPYLKRLGIATVQTIKISLGMSLCINFVAILLSLQGLLTPTTGALVHNAGSCLVVLFAAWLYDRNFDDGDDTERGTLPGMTKNAPKPSL